MRAIQRDSSVVAAVLPSHWGRLMDTATASGGGESRSAANPAATNRAKDPAADLTAAAAAATAPRTPVQAVAEGAGGADGATASSQVGAMPCHAVPYSAAPCHAVQCHAIPRHAVLCHAVSCRLSYSAVHAV